MSGADREALARDERERDPVRALFLRTWERLAPLVEDLQLAVPGGQALRYATFVSAGNALQALDAELPITIRVTGRYHDIGSFAADVANLSRIVTLHNLTIVGAAQQGAPAPQPGTATGLLGMDAIARTYRYLDASEIEAQRQAQAAAKKAGGAKP